VRRLVELGSEVSSSLEAARLEGDAAARVRAKLVARQVPRLRAEWRSDSNRLLGRRNVRFAAVATLAVAAAIALTAFLAWPTAREQQAATARAVDAPALSFIVGEGKREERGATGAFIAAPPTTPVPLTFSDGSTLRLGPAARLRVVELAREGARILVESGSVQVSVVHRDETRWAVEAGPFEVQVTGTSFDVAYDPTSSGLVVRMREGSVFVRGCGLLGAEGHRLSTGEQLAVSCKDKTMTVSAMDAPPTTPTTTTPTSTAVTALPDAPAPLGTSTSVVHSTRVDARSLMDLARKGAHSEALIAAEANGFGATCDALSGPELLVLADAARYASRFDRASEALETTRRRFAGSDAAAAAAFELGRIAMDVRHDLGSAGDHFETYLRERPSGSLAREALGRAIEARSRAGDSARAERLAVRYLATWPDGPHAKLARKLSAPDQDPRSP
jgi:hypothetical protein